MLQIEGKGAQTQVKINIVRFKFLCVLICLEDCQNIQYEKNQTISNINQNNHGIVRRRFYLIVIIFSFFSCRKLSGCACVCKLLSLNVVFPTVYIFIRRKIILNVQVRDKESSHIQIKKVQTQVNDIGRTCHSTSLQQLSYKKKP